MLANGLSPLVKILQQCWHEPYVPIKTVHAALVLFTAWATVSDVTEGTDRWRWKPLEGCIEEVVTLVTSRLVSLIAASGDSQSYPNDKGDIVVESGDAQVLLAALSAALKCSGSATRDATNSRTCRAPAFHPGVFTLRNTCVSFLAKCGEFRLPPTTHLLAIASLEVVVQAQAHTLNERVTWAETRMYDRDDMDGNFPVSRAQEVVLSLLQNKVEGRITSQNGSIGQG